jgi:hypothetical protein
MAEFIEERCLAGGDKAAAVLHVFANDCDLRIRKRGGVWQDEHLEWRELFAAQIEIGDECNRQMLLASHAEDTERVREESLHDLSTRVELPRLLTNEHAAHGSCFARDEPLLSPADFAQRIVAGLPARGGWHGKWSD